MKLKTIEVENFGSYTSLNFDFSSQGLALIYGATGSGKSTLQDAPAWILFGATAKDGNADDVRSWNYPNTATKGTAVVETPTGVISVHRVRGRPTQNDLYWVNVESGEVHRGKDINETQKLLEAKLGVTKDLYLTAAYYNEFSPTSSFFTAKAKDRRELFEKLANLDLPTNLLESIAHAKKEERKSLSDTTENLNRDLGRLEGLKHNSRTITSDIENWDESQTRKITDLKAKSKSFEKDKKIKVQDFKEKVEAWEIIRQEDKTRLVDEIEPLKASLLTLTDVCDECGQPNKQYNEINASIAKKQSKLSELTLQVNPFELKLRDAEKAINEFQSRLKIDQTLENPFLKQAIRIEKEFPVLEARIEKSQTACELSEHRIGSLTHLQELTAVLRAHLVRKAIGMVEQEANQYLEEYFDGEIRIGLEVDDSDDLSIEILKNTHPCAYRQLSKGQRGILKLCFSIAVMQVAANKSGVYFNTLLFDEPAEGADASLKSKSYRLFEALAMTHDSVLVIDHSTELKELFDKRYSVTIKSDESYIDCNQ